MNTDTYTKLEKICGGRKNRIAKLFGISAPAVTQWKGVIPLTQAEAVEQLTGGKITMGEVVKDFNRAKRAKACRS